MCDNRARINAAQLPSATRARFALLLTIGVLLAFSSGQTFSALNSPPFAPDSPEQDPVVAGVYVLIISVAVSTLIYMLHPWRQLRSFGSAKCLPENDLLSLRVGCLCSEVGVKMPVLLIDGDISNTDAIAFGWPWRKFLLLGRGLVLLHQTRPREFDARICHEIGHIRNGDIGITFFAHGLIVASICALLSSAFYYIFITAGIFYREWLQWRSDGNAFHAFLLAQIPPFQTISLVFAASVLQSAGWALILIIEHRGFLRARELYADATSANIVGAESMNLALGRGTSESSTALEVFAFHPKLDDRRAVIADPTKLLRPKVIGLLSVGYIVGLVLSAMTILTSVPYLAPPDFEQFVNPSFMRETLNNRPILILFAVYTALGLPMAIVLGSIMFRYGSCLALNTAPALFTLCHAVVGLSVLAIGSFLGFVVNPRIFELLWRGTGGLDGYLPQTRQIATFLFLPGFMLMGAICCAPFLFRLFRGHHIKPPSKAVWLAIGVSFYLFASTSLYGVLLIVLGGPVLKDLPLEISVGSALLILSTFYASIAYLFARRSVSLLPVQFRPVAPWLFSTRR